MGFSPRALVATRRRAGAMVVVVVLLLAGGGAWALTRPDAATATAGETLVAATTSTQRSTVSATGTIQPARRADLSFTVAGTVTSVPVSVGQTVTAGQSLATVGADTLEAAVTTAQASLTAAQAALSAQLDADGSATQLASARAQVASAQSKLADAEQSVDAATLTSTIAGTVAAVGISVGDRESGSASASSGSSGGSGSTGTAAAAASSTTGTAGVITVISTDAYVVDASVGSADLARVKKGLQAEITPTGATTRVFGTVSTVGIVATTSTSTTGSATFPVVIDVTGTPAGLYAGGSASVVIIVSQTPDVLTVPTLALHTTGSTTVVNQQKNGHQVSTPVTIGTSYGAVTQILSGLAAGDEVLVSTVRPGGTGGAVRQRTGGTGAGGAGGFGGGTGGFGGGFPGAGGAP